jgi:hypothetical protein
MRGINWRRLRRRDFYAAGLIVLISQFTFFGDMYVPQHFAPCPNPDWRDVASFFATLSLIAVFLEGLNGATYLLARELRRHASFEASRSATDLCDQDLLIPSGWTGLLLGLVFLIAPFLMNNSFQCDPLRTVGLSWRYFETPLMLAYGALLLGQIINNANSKISLPYPQ